MQTFCYIFFAKMIYKSSAGRSFFLTRKLAFSNSSIIILEETQGGLTELYSSISYSTQIKYPLSANVL